VCECVGGCVCECVGEWVSVCVVLWYVCVLGSFVCRRMVAVRAIAEGVCGCTYVCVSVCVCSRKTYIYSDRLYPLLDRVDQNASIPACVYLYERQCVFFMFWCMCVCVRVCLRVCACVTRDSDLLGRV